MKYLFGGDTDLSYDEIQRRRKIAQQLQGSIGSPSNVGEGLTAIGKALRARLDTSAANRADEARMNRIMAGEARLTDYPTQGLSDGAQTKIMEALMRGAPAYQTGTMFHPGGQAVVGERGPEVVNLPRGAQVLPFDDPALVRAFQNLSPQEQSSVLGKIEQGATPDQAFQPDGYSPYEVMGNDSDPDRAVNLGLSDKVGGNYGATYYNENGMPTSGPTGPLSGAPEPWQRRLNTIQSNLDFPDDATPEELDAMRREQGHIMDRYQPMTGGAGDAEVPGQQGEDDLAPTPDEIAQLAPDIFNPEILADLGLNVSESKNLGYALRMLQAEETLRTLEKQGTRMWPRTLEWLPGESIENQLFSPEYRQYVRAREAFANAALRADTGAQINESEVPRIIKETMPLPGDDEATLADRRAGREAFIRGIMAGTGPAAQYLPNPGDPLIKRGGKAPGELSDDEILKMLGQ